MGIGTTGVRPSDYTVKDISGKDNVVADYLSRWEVDSENC